MIIDFHGHVGRWDALDMVDDPAEMLRAMDAVGIDKSCVFNIFHPDGKPGNDQTAAFVARHPDRFIGFAYVCPTCPDTVRPELERAIRRTRVPGDQNLLALYALSARRPSLGSNLRLCR